MQKIYTARSGLWAVRTNPCREQCLCMHSSSRVKDIYFMDLLLVKAGFSCGTDILFSLQQGTHKKCLQAHGKLIYQRRVQPSSYQVFSLCKWFFFKWIYSNMGSIDTFPQSLGKSQILPSINSVQAIPENSMDWISLSLAISNSHPGFHFLQQL